MNLLKYKNRFRQETFSPTDIYEVNGYMKAMQDFLQLIGDVTEYNPAKRFIDSVPLCDAIADTNKALQAVQINAGKELIEMANNELKAKVSGVSLSGYKVDQFLKEQVQPQDADDLKDIL